jgi:glycosyltransferase involved in cell wall biosynthesis
VSTQRTPRVLHIGKYLPPVPGGIETYLGDLLRVSMRHGFEVGAVVHGKQGFSDPDPEDFGGAKIYSVRTHGQLLYAPIAPSIVSRLRHAIRDFNPDVLHLHMPNTSAFAVLLLPEAKKIPWLVHWHSDVEPNGMGSAFKAAHRCYRFFESAILRKCVGVIATSKDYLSASQTLLPYWDKCSVIPLALDEQRIRSISDPRDRWCDVRWPSWPGKKFLAVGRLAEYKGFEVLLSVISRSDAGSLAIAGDGPLFSTLKARIEQLSLQHRVALLGPVSDEQLAELYRSADVVCIPSLDRHEAFGLVALEAMHFQKPIIASNILGSGLTWLVGNYARGCLVPVGDIVAWGQAVERAGQSESGVQITTTDVELQNSLSESWSLIRDLWVKVGVL